MEMKRYKLGEIATVEISGVDKKAKENEKPIKLCNFTDVYHNWAITRDMEISFMDATATDKEIDTFVLKKGQVAFTKDSETRDDIGIPTYIADDFDNVILGYHTALITPDKTNLSGKYLNAFMNSNFIKKYFENNASGSGQRYTLSNDTLNSIPIILPEISIQEKIGEFFSNIDRKIALNKKINAKLEAMAKRLYDYWFVQFDYPDKNGKPYKTSGGKMVWNEVLKREIPEGWEVKSVNDISVSYRGVGSTADDEKSAEDNDVVLILRGNNISNNHIIYDGNTVYLDKSFVSEEQKIHKYDFVMTMSSGSKEHVGKSAMFLFDSPHSYGAFCNKITPAKDCQFFLENYLHSEYFKKYIQITCSGTGINNLTNEHFDKAFFPFPDNEVLESFNQKIKPIYEQIGVLEKENLRLMGLRDKLLPLLMNGQVQI